MLASTEGIVLHFIKYGESSVIATIYTKEFGRHNYLINAARSKKSQNKTSLLQPLFLVDLVAYQKSSKDLHRLKEIKSGRNYQQIPFSVVKSTMALFLAEILHKTLKEQESFPEMFDFIQNSLLYFDLMDRGFSNFHLFFLFRLTEYLGFLPDTTPAGHEGWFDIRTGNVAPHQPSHPLFANKDITQILIRLAKLRIQDLPSFKISREEKNDLISVLLDYYQLHFDDLGEIKSMRVLKEVFND